MKFLIYILTTVIVSAQNLYTLNTNGPALLSPVIQVQSLALADSSNASNAVRSLIIPVTGNYTVSAADTNGMRTTNIIFAVNTDGGNSTFTFPPTFVNTFKVLNVGTNWVVNTASSGLTFLTYPTNRTITFGATLNNKYAGKVQEFSMLNATNYVVTSDFRPLVNIIDDSTNSPTVSVTNFSTLLSTNGHWFPSNTVTVASVGAGMTNGGYWLGVMSNALQAGWWTNGVLRWKKLAP